MSALHPNANLRPYLCTALLTSHWILMDHTDHSRAGLSGGRPCHAQTHPRQPRLLLHAQGNAFLQQFFVFFFCCTTSDWSGRSRISMHLWTLKSLALINWYIYFPRLHLFVPASLPCLFDSRTAPGEGDRGRQGSRVRAEAGSVRAREDVHPHYGQLSSCARGEPAALPPLPRAVLPRDHQAPVRHDRGKLSAFIFSLFS